MNIDVIGFFDWIVKGFLWAFKLPGPDDFTLGLGWYLILAGAIGFVFLVIFGKQRR